MRRVSGAAAVVAVAVAVAAFLGLAGGENARAKANATVNVQLLAFNDFHGNIEPPGGTFAGVPAGGSEFFATHIAQLRATNPNTVVVAAGDLIGATPLTSALFQDEPTIESLSQAGLQVSGVGNHEFDEGKAELLRMQRGGCHPTKGCQDGTPFEGAKFQYLSANVFLMPTAAEKAAEKKNAAFCKQAKNKKSPRCKKVRPKPLLPAYTIREVGGVKIGFIGMTLEGTPTIVTPAGVAGLAFYDEAYMANYWAQALKKRGVQTIVILIHEGGFQIPGAGINDCIGISGPIVEITHLMSNDIDVVVSGHTHQAYNCRIGTKLVTSASAFGRLITDIDLTVDTTTGDVTSKAARNVVVTRTVPKAADQTALVERYRALAAPLANRVIGSITADITRTANAAGESALGDVIADAQLAATRDPAKGGAVISFMNPGGIRADLLHSQVSGGEQAGQITYSEAFTVQPFGNTLVVKTMTGDQIRRLLEQQFDNPSPGQSRILQVSEGFTYSYDLRQPAGSRIVAGSIRLNGQPISPTATYRVTMNSFLADGGDNFGVFREGTNQLGGEVDLDALAAYFAARSPVAPGPRNRITRVG